jgi:hypothetical protein
MGTLCGYDDGFGDQDVNNTPSLDKPMTQNLRVTFLLHWIVCAILGAALWLIPGRTLTLVGWVGEFIQLPESNLSIPGQTFVDPFITRLYGAALLALAFSSYLGWKAKRWEQVAMVVKQEAAFCVLGVVSFFAVLLLAERPMPLSGWAVMLLLAAFAIAWGVDWWSEGRTAKT